tara:strand:+ start:1767 stop:2189 length:423 start_codon:yes stop_codon:yes gene_type:complete
LRRLISLGVERMAQYEDLIVDQGSDVEIKLELFNPDGSQKILNKFNIVTQTLEPMFNASGKIKKSFNSKDSDSISFGASTISPSNAENELYLSLSNTVTDAMKSGRYVYDVEISATDSFGVTTIERILEGKLTVSPSVTK